VNELRIQRCGECDAAWFPDRLRCPRCGGRSWRRIAAGTGTVEELTAEPREAIELASIRLDAGPVVIARLEPGTAPGARVLLERNGRQQTWARSAPPDQ
jgi:uncharacterized OB-fold protein